VQHKQFNFVLKGTRAAVVALPLLAICPALAGSIVQPSKPDPLLDGGPTDPCAAGADCAPGIDANGKPVVVADIAAGRVPLPDSVAIPVGPSSGASPGPGRSFGQGRDRGRGRRPSHPTVTDNASNRDSTYVALDGRKLEPLLNPTPCGALR